MEAGPAKRVLRRARAQVDRLGLSSTAKQVLERNLTYLAPRKLRNIEWVLDQIEQNHVPGSLIETGVALGGSAILIAKSTDEIRAFHGYDVFGMIPPPSSEDPPEVHQRYEIIQSGQSEGLGGQTYYGYQENLYDQVVASFASFGVPVDQQRVSLHKGLFEATLHPSGPVAFAHIDCDWYEPVRLSLERIYPHLQSGGFVISDDYFDYGGAAEAVDEFRAAHDDLMVVTDRSDAHMVLRRR